MMDMTAGPVFTSILDLDTFGDRVEVFTSPGQLLQLHVTDVDGHGKHTTILTLTRDEAKEIIYALKEYANG
jgi:hypothetical protein